MHPEIPVLSFISAALALVPLIWYFQARNIAAIAIGIWLSITNLTYAVDALIWAENTDIRASVWCDVSTSLITASHIALPAACFSICIHLERLASFYPTSTPQTKKRRILFECLMCFGLPLMYTVLHLVVQPRRFDLFYSFGCRPATYPTVATIFLVMIPPLLLTVGAIVCMGLAWHHFLVHGVQFCGKRGPISSLTRNLYIRLAGMAILEAVLSAVLISILMWRIFSAGLAPMENMSRRLSEVRTWGPDEITHTIWTALGIEWSVTVVQSVAFFGLFTCRMEVVRKAWEQIRSFVQCPKRQDSSPSVMVGRSTPEQSATSLTVPSPPFTVVDLSLVIPSASTLASYGHSVSKSLPPTPLRPCSPAEETPEEVIVAAIDPAMMPLESPSRASAVASSHNSLESNFDPDLVFLPLDMWPKTPTSIPVRPDRRSCIISMGRDPKRWGWLDTEMPFPRVKPAVHVHSCAEDHFAMPPGYGLGERQAVYHMTVVKEKR